jgi:predicted O-methyltransferase YrrM
MSTTLHGNGPSGGVGRRNGRLGDMAQPTWTAVDDYLEQALLTPDDALDAALRHSRDQGLPAISVSATQGKLLALLARSVGARRVLEVGTLGGYSTIWLARALPAGGEVVSLEIDPHHAEVARANLARAGLADRVEVRVGPAVDTLATMVGVAAGSPPFDLVFIDADKTSNADYFAHAMRLTRPGSLIVVDNVVRNGAVADTASRDANVLGVRRLMDAMAAEPRIDATAVQTVGSKGYDGFALGLVVAAPS